ncbi:chaperonin 10-like protein [Xylogone sp. PMI_703]|nr:chaperonin 10-like protein [Xylogone sp. PMI_703]
MADHEAIATVAVRAPLAAIRVPTVEPTEREVLVRVEWTASTPLDLHQNDGGLLVKHPQILGSSVAGTVQKIGPKVQNLSVGDEVFGFCFEEPKHKAYQELITVPETYLGKLPKGFSFQEAVTLPCNVVTAFHAITHDLSLPLPWPCPPNPSPPHADVPILIWGGATSCGQYVIQILTHWGYKNLFTTASLKNHSYLRSLGAAHVFDYRDPDVAKLILEKASSYSSNPAMPFILDCIGSKVALIQESKIAQKGSRVAVLLPTILRDATEEDAPEYSMDVQSSETWAEGVETRGVRTHSYAKNAFFKEYLQSTIVPTLLEQGIIRPNKQKIVEGKTLLERAQKALDILRRRDVSAERLVWRVADAVASS